MDLRIINKTGAGYSPDMSIDPVIDTGYADSTSDEQQIDLSQTFYMLNCDADAMFEIKYPDRDIRVRSMAR